MLRLIELMVQMKFEATSGSGWVRLIIKSLLMKAVDRLEDKIQGSMFIVAYEIAYHMD